MRRAAPGAIGVLVFLLAWELTVRLGQIPSFTLPPPSLVALTVAKDFPSLSLSTWFTLKVTLGALLLACVSGVVVAALFALWRPLERAMLPLAVVLQVTPVVAVAPLILIYVDSTAAALLACAWVVAFFPILSNTVVGLRVADPALSALFKMYQASPWQRLRLLLAPSALPYFLAGLRVSGGLSLIGAVTAEMVAGAAGRETGLASRILEASFRTDTPRMFAALSLLVACGVVIFMALNALSQLLIGRWQPAQSE